MNNPVAGINLRQDDINNFVNTCQHANIDPSIVPIVAILHDDTDQMLASSLQAFSAFRVYAYRCMSPNSQLPIRPANAGGIPLNSAIIGWNEADNSNGSDWNLPGWVDGWWKQVRQNRPDLTIHYGAPNVDGIFTENAALEAALDIVDRHIGATFSPPAAIIQGKPVAVTEVDVDPNHPETYDQLVGCMQNCLNKGIAVFAWGLNPDVPDVVYRGDIIQAIVNLNKETHMPDFVIGPGFKAAIAAKGWHAASDEVYFTQSANAKLSVVSCNEGLLFYDSFNNKVGTVNFD